MIVPSVKTASSAGLPPPVNTELKMKKRMTLTITFKKKMLIYLDISFHLPGITKFCSP